MVEIIIQKNKLDEIISIEVSGHAGYADYGQDIVCSAVSVLTINTVNSIAHLLGINLEPVSESGILQCQFPRQSNVELNDKMQLLLHSMLLGLKDIKNNYNDFIKYDIIYV